MIWIIFNFAYHQPSKEYAVWKNLEQNALVALVKISEDCLGWLFELLTYYCAWYPIISLNPRQHWTCPKNKETNWVLLFHF